MVITKEKSKTLVERKCRIDSDISQLIIKHNCEFFLRIEYKMVFLMYLLWSLNSTL